MRNLIKRSYKKNEIEILVLKDLINEMEKMQQRASTTEQIKFKTESLATGYNL